MLGELSQEEWVVEMKNLIPAADSIVLHNFMLKPVSLQVGARPLLVRGGPTSCP